MPPRHRAPALSCHTCTHAHAGSRRTRQHTCTNAHARTRMHSQAHVHAYMCKYTCRAQAHAQAHMDVHNHTCTLQAHIDIESTHGYCKHNHTQAHMNTTSTRAHTHTCTFLHTHALIPTHKRTHKCMHSCADIHAHAITCMHVWACVLMLTHGRPSTCCVQGHRAVSAAVPPSSFRPSVGLALPLAPPCPSLMHPPPPGFPRGLHLLWPALLWTQASFPTSCWHGPVWKEGQDSFSAAHLPTHPAPTRTSVGIIRPKPGGTGVRVCVHVWVCVWACEFVLVCMAVCPCVSVRVQVGACGCAYGMHTRACAWLAAAV